MYVPVDNEEQGPGHHDHDVHRQQENPRWNKATNFITSRLDVYKEYRFFKGRWINHDFNAQYRIVLDCMGTVPYRTYRLYVQ